MIKLLPKIDGVIDRFDRPFLRKRRFTGVFNGWPPFWTSLTCQPLFDCTPVNQSLYESEVVVNPLFEAAFVGRPEAVAGVVGSTTDLITNGTFDTDSDWVKGDGWTIAGGVARWDEPLGAGTDIAQDFGVLVGHSYLVIYTIVARGGTPPAANETRCSIGGNTGAFRGVGTWSEILTAVNTDPFRILADVEFSPGDAWQEIDNVKVYDITTLDLVGTPTVEPLYESEVESNG